MPRNVKESDDEVETKGGRKPRTALNSSVLDSPLRRSSRIKHPTNQDVSSPESVSDVSSVGAGRNTRRRTTTGDSGIPEAPRNLRTRRNSVASDISELTETESLPDGPSKRVTRRSVAGVPSAETPTKLNARMRRTTRAGSETKSTPPIARTTRRTRASSMEPEAIEEPIIGQIGTPAKSRKRASALPSEPAVAEESEDGRSSNSGKPTEKTVYEIDEDELGTKTPSPSQQQNSKSDANESDEKMEVDASPVKESEGDTYEKSVEETTELTTDVSGSSRNLDESMKITETPDADLQKLSTPAKGSSHPIENISNNSPKNQDKSPGNKENEIIGNGDALIDTDKNVKLANNETRLFKRRSFSSSRANITEKRPSISSSDDNRNESKLPIKSQEISGTEIEKRSSETLIKKEYLVDECVVLIEPMNIINKVDKVAVAQTSVASNSPKTEDETFRTRNIKSPSVQLQDQQDKIPQKSNIESHEDAENKEDDKQNCDENFTISNVSIAGVDEKDKTQDETATSPNKEAKLIQSNEPVEIVNLESDAAEEEEIVLRTTSDAENTEDEEIASKSTSNEPETLNPVEETSCKTITDVVVNEEMCTEQEIFNAETEIDSQSSITNEKPQEIEDNVVDELVKGKSSIVTESPVSGAQNVAEVSVVSEEQNNDKSASSPTALGEKLIEDTAANLSLNKNAAESKVLESDNDSECNGYPTFKDIPADEWKGTAETDEIEKDNEFETNSIRSASTERNESECELELVDKEGSQGNEKYAEDKREPKSDYDTDDTLIATQIHTTRPKGKDEETAKEILVEEEPMELGSDFEENATAAAKSPKESPKKRLSLNASRKSNGANVSLINKNESIVGNNSVKESSPSSFNVSRRKSQNDGDVDSPMLDSSLTNVTAANVSVKSNRSISGKSPKKRRSSSNALALNYSESSDSEEERKNNESKTPTKAAQMINRKSIDGSAKKVDTSKANVSAKNTPAKIEVKANGTPAKRKSLSKLTSVYDFNGSDDTLDNVEEQKTSQASSESELAMSDESPVTTQNVKEQHNASAKAGSAKKSASNRSSAKFAEMNSYSENEDEPSPDKRNNKSLKSPGGKVDRNKSYATQESSDSETEANNRSKQVSASPKVETGKLDKSAKQGSAKKSTVNKNNSKIAQMDSDDEMDVDDTKKNLASPVIDLREKLNKSAKSASAKKLANNKNSSKIVQMDSNSEAEEEHAEKDEDEDQNEPLRKLIQSRMGSAKKLLIDVDKNYSTIAQVNSDSEEMESSSDSEDINVTNLIPQYFFDQDSTSDSINNSESENEEESSDTIDSDVARDMNLHGKTSLEYSDDDVPADDCMATESESSDSDDDGADLLDFVVDDDEEEDSFEDVANDLGAGDEESDDYVKVTDKKQRKRIITRPGGDSDSDESEEQISRTKINTSDLDKSAAAKTPKKDKKLNKSQEIEEPEIQTADLNVSSKNLAKKNKNLLIQSSTPKGAIRDVLALDKVNTPKSATPLSISLKETDSPTKINTPKGAISDVLSLDKVNTPKWATALSKSLKETDTPTKIEAAQITSAKKLSKSMCETVETPTKLGSSFKVAKTPKTPLAVAEQLQTSLTTDLANSSGKLNLSKTKSTKVSALNQTMLTPNSGSPETRFLMKEKLNDTMPALKLQQKAKRRSMLANLGEDVAAIEEQMEVVDEKNVSVREEGEPVDEPEVASTEKRKKKKKAAKKVDASNGPEDEILATSRDAEEIEGDVSNKKSKKQKKKNKAAETEAQVSIESNTEVAPIKDKKKKKKESKECIEANQINEQVKKDKKQKTTVEQVDDEIQTNELSKKDKKKKKRDDESAEEPQLEALIKKDKKRKHQKTVETVEAPISKKKSLRVSEETVAAETTDATSLQDSRKIKQQQTQIATSTGEIRKIKSRSDATNSVETLKTTLKRLPEEVLESLSDAAERPKKRRKIAKAEKILPSRTMFSSRHQPSPSLSVEDGFVPLSACGGTTQFDVVTLSKPAKKSKKAIVAGTFRERMLARNPRQPVSAYLMYQQKQKASGKDRPY